MSGYTQSPNDMLWRRDLSRDARFLFLLLLSRTNVKRDGCYKTWIGNEALADGMGCSRSTVKRVLAELTERKLISVESTPRSRTITLTDGFDGMAVVAPL